MRVPRVLFTMRSMLIAVAVMALLIGSGIAMNELDRRTDLFSKEADDHHRRQVELAAEAADLESLAGDPAREEDLPLALFRAGRWSRGKALEMEVESLASGQFLPSPRWNQLVSKARATAIAEARADRRLSEYHARERMRYERVAASPWLPIEPEPPRPGP
jgi:hypothetical protein